MAPRRREEPPGVVLRRARRGVHSSAMGDDAGCGGALHRVARSRRGVVRHALRIVLAEDAALLREGLVGILERAGHEVCAAVADADALRAYVERERPDVVITDIRMPPDHTDEGLRAAVAIRADHPEIAIMVLSAYIAEAYVAELLDATTGA